MDSGMETGGIAVSGSGGDPTDLVAIFGTMEPPVPWRAMQVGALSFLLSEQSIRSIKWHGVELVRAISWPVRDENWATYPCVTLNDATARSDGRITGRIEQEVSGGRLGLVVEFSANDAGLLTVSVTMTPVGGPFATNRAGLTVLHPILGLSGGSVRVTHPGGAEEITRFPEQIMPSQPMKEITGLAYAIGAAHVDVSFEGEVFEMEDQRNWSDASYKTYCVPLKEPFTYEIGAPVTQRVRLSLRGDAPVVRRAERAPALGVEPLGQVAPAIGLALEEGWEGDAAARDLIAGCGASHLLLRLRASVAPAFLDEAGLLAGRLGAGIDVELLLEDAEPFAAIDTLAAKLAAAGIAPERVLALNEAYLKSYQPSATWPEGPQPHELVAAARRVFREALIGGGMLTNFTEFNRCRPDPAVCDYVFHGNSATVHASDDLSVMETLEALPQVFSSAEALSGGLAYRLGLVSIGMRTNPYGSSVSENTVQLRETMARADPRHRGLFGAAWAVGVLASTAGSRVEALCLGAPTGPFGLAYMRQRFLQPGFDRGEGVVVPLYHVVRLAREMAGHPRVALSGLPEGVAAYGATVNGATRIMVANLTRSPQSLALPRAAEVTILDGASASAAMKDPNWLDTAPRKQQSDLRLEGYAVAMLEMEG
ncbi:hypothetical protein [Oceanicola sp. 502str15]|uniref:hypothetical protein n=1 Tax=Oceanicola sp. 502str15 TaxID=2696061 RepID=UPI00273A7102|nr:hypothetical protein [Oceanicola sp. 502str15]MCO6384315.1 hypothetical protein [Oceanicola sp. 502str15]